MQHVQEQGNRQRIVCAYERICQTLIAVHSSSGWSACMHMDVSEGTDSVVWCLQISTDLPNVYIYICIRVDRDATQRKLDIAVYV